MPISVKNKISGNLAGIRGPQGETGNGIEKIEKTNTVGIIDTYTITYTNGQKATYEIKNGEIGPIGPIGPQGQQGIQGESYDDTQIKQEISNHETKFNTIEQEQLDQNTNISQNKTDIELLEENLSDEITTEEVENIVVKDAIRWYSKLDVSGNSVQEQTENIPGPNSSSEIQNCGDNINFLDNKLITVGSINDVLNQEMQFSSNNARARFSRLIPLQENIDTFTISCNDKYTISIAEYNVNNLCIKTSSAWTDKYTFTKSKDTTQISIKFKKIDDSNFTQEELQEIKCKLEKRQNSNNIY